MTKIISLILLSGQEIPQSWMAASDTAVITGVFPEQEEHSHCVTLLPLSVELSKNHSASFHIPSFQQGSHRKNRSTKAACIVLQPETPGHVKDLGTTWSHTHIDGGTMRKMATTYFLKAKGKSARDKPFHMWGMHSWATPLDFNTCWSHLQNSQAQMPYGELLGALPYKDM